MCGSTSNKLVQVVAQHCCVVCTLENNVHRITTPQETCHATKIDVASCGCLLQKVEGASTFCNNFFAICNIDFCFEFRA